MDKCIWFIRWLMAVGIQNWVFIFSLAFYPAFYAYCLPPQEILLSCMGGREVRRQAAGAHTGSD